MREADAEQPLEGGMNVQMWLSNGGEVHAQLELQEKIWDALRGVPEPEIEGVNVEVEAFVATLTGWVPSDLARLDVLRAAEGVPGIVTVISELVVKG